MTGIVNHTQSRLASLALRRRSADHPMAMFSTFTAAALATMAYTATAGTWGAATPRIDPAAINKADAKTSRLPMTGKPGSACTGLAWSAETPECLREITIDSGRKPLREIRIIMTAEADHQRPNMF